MYFTKSGLLLGALLLLTLNSSAQNWLTNGLVAYYPFDGNANDASGNGNGAVVYGASLGTNRFNQTGNGYRFNAKFQWVGTTNYNGFPESTNDFTVSAWIKLEKLNPSDHAIIFANHLVDNFQLGMIPFNASGTALQFYTGNGMVCQSTQLLLQSNTWYNVAIVRRQNVVTLFVDGTNVGQSVVNTGNNATDSYRNLDFGFRGSSSQHQLYGQIDDIRIYNRAISTNEVGQIYRLDDSTSISVKTAIYLESTTMRVGGNYQIQTSTNLLDWDNYGAVFTATNTAWESPDVWKVDRNEHLFFRLQRQ